ncbi:hypothetical protein O3M35_010227 [Rhynocoris fuscipes]|uniref:Uncharacterized protein n=1 Tax=Rhynocoris fuscipes TaxID=488301 RepID=A0AAW1CZ37_9HEMI
MTIILLIIYFIKSTLFYMFDKLARTAIFAKLVMAYKAFVIIKLLELKRYLWWVKEEEKGQYHHGISVHDHVYEEEIPEHHHYDSSPPWSGGWPYGRGHKKKKRKAVKKAIIKLVLIALLIKHKIKMLLTAFHTFLAFKAALLTSILVVIHGIKLWIEIKHKHHPQKVIYYENAHHTHYDDHHDEHFDDHHNSGWNFWGRSGVEAPTSTPPPTNYYNSIASYLTKRSSTGADNLAYSAYAPQEIAKN